MYQIESITIFLQIMVNMSQQKEDQCFQVLHCVAGYSDLIIKTLGEGYSTQRFNKTTKLRKNHMKCRLNTQDADLVCI